MVKASVGSSLIRIKEEENPVRQHIALTALLVADYDEAIGFYAGKLGFTQDLYGNRWDLIGPSAIYSVMHKGCITRAG